MSLSVETMPSRITCCAVMGLAHASQISPSAGSLQSRAMPRRMPKADSENQVKRTTQWSGRGSYDCATRRAGARRSTRRGWSTRSERDGHRVARDAAPGKRWTMKRLPDTFPGRGCHDGGAAVALSGMLRMIAPEDTFIVGDGRLSHLDGHRPRVLSPEERVVLFRFCSEHTVSECEQCAKAYRLSELASDLLSGREHQCSR